MKKIFIIVLIILNLLSGFVFSQESPSGPNLQGDTSQGLLGANPESGSVVSKLQDHFTNGGVYGLLGPTDIEYIKTDPAAREELFRHMDKLGPDDINSMADDFYEIDPAKFSDAVSSSKLSPEKKNSIVNHINENNQCTSPECLDGIRKIIENANDIKIANPENSDTIKGIKIEGNKLVIKSLSTNKNRI